MEKRLNKLNNNIYLIRAYPAYYNRGYAFGFIKRFFA